MFLLTPEGISFKGRNGKTNALPIGTFNHSATNMRLGSRPPREARQPGLNPWLYFDKYKMGLAAAARL